MGEIVAEEGTYPSNGVSGSYWYVKDRLVFPQLELNINSIWKIAEMGWVNIDRTWRNIESIYTNIDSTWKQIT